MQYRMGRRFWGIAPMIDGIHCGPKSGPIAIAMRAGEKCCRAHDKIRLNAVFSPFRGLNSAFRAFNPRFRGLLHPLRFEHMHTFKYRLSVCKIGPPPAKQGQFNFRAIRLNCRTLVQQFRQPRSRGFFRRVRMGRVFLPGRLSFRTLGTISWDERAISSLAPLLGRR